MMTRLKNSLAISAACLLAIIAECVDHDRFQPSRALPRFNDVLFVQEDDLRSEAGVAVVQLWAWQSSFMSSWVESLPSLQVK